MPGPNRPGVIPPDVPPEYVEAYRRGYERAFEEGASEVEADHTARLESLEFAFERDRPQREDLRSRGRMTPVLLGVLALLLIVSAYGLGKLFSAEVTSTEASAEPGAASDSTVVQEGSGGDSQTEAYDGPLQAAAIGDALASCQSDSGVDSAGNQVAYDPSNVHDGDLSTAWRCDGGGVGQRVTIGLADGTVVGEVGLVPGYAKTDPSSGADRYAENNRITRVRWLFSDGSSVTQELDGSPYNRSMQTMRIPETESDEVVIEILGSTSGPRNTVAISEVRVGAVP